MPALVLSLCEGLLKALRQGAPALGLSFSLFMCLCLAKTPVAGSMTSEQAMPCVKQACVTGEPCDLLLRACPGAVEQCCAGLTASCCRQAGVGVLSYCPRARALQRWRTPTSLAVEVRLYPSVELGAVNLNCLCREKKMPYLLTCHSSLLCSFC